jgi:hypothetical protein
VSTPLSIQISNGKSQNAKNQRNLKNFSAQSAAVNGATTIFKKS